MSIRDRLLLTSTEKEKFENKIEENKDQSEKFEQIRGALGISEIEWQNVMDATSEGEIETLLVKYLGIEEDS